MATVSAGRVMVRTDLIADELSVPVGNKWVSSGEFDARWEHEGTDKEQFQIYFEEKWVDAYSIDFEFI